MFRFQSGDQWLEVSEIQVINTKPMLYLTTTFSGAMCVLNECENVASLGVGWEFTGGLFPNVTQPPVITVELVGWIEPELALAGIITMICDAMIVESLLCDCDELPLELLDDPFNQNDPEWWLSDGWLSL